MIFHFIHSFFFCIRFFGFRGFKNVQPKRPSSRTVTLRKSRRVITPAGCELASTKNTRWNFASLMADITARRLVFSVKVSKCGCLVLRNSCTGRYRSQRDAFVSPCKARIGRKTGGNQHLSQVEIKNWLIVPSNEWHQDSSPAFQSCLSHPMSCSL